MAVCRQTLTITKKNATRNKVGPGLEMSLTGDRDTMFRFVPNRRSQLVRLRAGRGNLKTRNLKKTKSKNTEKPEGQALSLVVDRRHNVQSKFEQTNRLFSRAILRNQKDEHCHWGGTTCSETSSKQVDSLVE